MNKDDFAGSLLTINHIVREIVKNADSINGLQIARYARLIQCIIREESMRAVMTELTEVSKKIPLDPQAKTIIDQRICDIGIAYSEAIIRRQLEG
jgi:hypothetical protein|nr:MAG TPA: hypothetical protein [Caudoviricetes sp.]